MRNGGVLNHFHIKAFHTIIEMGPAAGTDIMWYLYLAWGREH